MLVVVTMHVHPSLLGSADYSRRASCRNWDVFKGVFRSKQHFLQFHMQLLVSCHHDCNAAQAYTCPHLYQMASRVRAGALPLPVLVATRTTANVPSALPPLWICAQVSMPYCYSVNQQYIVLTKHCAFHDPHLRHSIFFFLICRRTRKPCLLRLRRRSLRWPTALGSLLNR